MSFIRTKEIPPGSGNHYEYEVESYRDGDSVRQRVIRYIGRVGGGGRSAVRSRKPEKKSEAPFSLGNLPEVVEQKPEVLSQTMIEFSENIPEDKKSQMAIWLKALPPKAKINLTHITMQPPLEPTQTQSPIAMHGGGRIGFWGDKRITPFNFYHEVGHEIIETDNYHGDGNILPNFSRLIGADSKSIAAEEVFAQEFSDWVRNPDSVTHKVGQYFNDTFGESPAIERVSKTTVNSKGENPEAPKPDIVPVMTEQKLEAKPASLPVSSGAEVPEQKPFAKSEKVQIPMGRNPKSRAKVEAPRYVYHDVRSRGLAPNGGISGYSLKGMAGEKDLYNLYSDPNPEAGYVYLSLEPLSPRAHKIDLSKIDADSVRFTGQAEGYLLYRGSIPPEAIVKDS